MFFGHAQPSIMISHINLDSHQLKAFSNKICPSLGCSVQLKPKDQPHIVETMKIMLVAFQAMDGYDVHSRIFG